MNHFVDQATNSDPLTIHALPEINEAMIGDKEL